VKGWADAAVSGAPACASGHLDNAPGQPLASTGAKDPPRHPLAARGDDDRKIESELDDDGLAEVIDQFVASLPNQLDNMRQALAHNHFEELQRLSHQLKGAGGSYGYPSLTDAARALEDAAADADTEAANLALKEMADLCRAVGGASKGGYSPERGDQ